MQPISSQCFMVLITTLISMIESRNIPCASDIPCPAGQRCVLQRSTCSYPPCNRYPVCVDISPGSSESITKEVSRPGVCPVPVTRGPCVTQCENDVDCQGDNVCCFNGCGFTCSSRQVVAATKPGTCPRNLRNEDLCGMDCTSDNDCPGVEKCCLTACGSTCSRPCYYWLFTTTRKSSGSRSAIWSLPYICRRL